MELGAFHPLLRGIGQIVVDVMAILLFGRRIDDPGDMARLADDEAARPAAGLQEPAIQSFQRAM